MMARDGDVTVTLRPEENQEGQPCDRVYFNGRRTGFVLEWLENGDNPEEPKTLWLSMDPGDGLIIEAVNMADMLGKLDAVANPFDLGGVVGETRKPYER